MASKAGVTLERLVRRLSPDQLRTLAHAAYALDKPILLLDSTYSVFFASREAERQLGYTLDQIKLDTRRFQTEKKESFDEVMKGFFANNVAAFNLKNLLYQSTNRKHNILVDVHVRQLPNGGVYVQLDKVERYDAKKRPGMFQFRYKHAVGDRVVRVKGFVDYRNDQKFLEEVNAAYVSTTNTANHVVIDLSQAQDIMPSVLEQVAKKSNVVFVNPNDALTAALLMAEVPFDRIQRYEKDGHLKPIPAPA